MAKNLWIDNSVVSERSAASKGSRLGYRDSYNLNKWLSEYLADNSITAGANTLYSADDTITGVRVVNGGGFNLTFSNIAQFGISTSTLASISKDLGGPNESKIVVGNGNTDIDIDSTNGDVQLLAGNNILLQPTVELRLLTPETAASNVEVGWILKVQDATTGEVEFEPHTEPVIIACSDLTSDLATGTNVGYVASPKTGTISTVWISVLEAPTGSVLTVDINKNGSTILSTKLTIDPTENTSLTAATAAVLSDTSVTKGDILAVDIDGVGSTTTGKGLITYIEID